MLDFLAAFSLEFEFSVLPATHINTIQHERMPRAKYLDTNSIHIYIYICIYVLYIYIRVYIYKCQNDVREAL